MVSVIATHGLHDSDRLRFWRKEAFILNHSQSHLKKMKRVVNVSYRLPVTVKERAGKKEVQVSSGGLVSAIRSLKGGGCDLVWSGVADFEESDFDQISAADSDLLLKPVFLEKEINEAFYNGFSNSVLWPLFHYFPSFVEYNPDDFKAAMSCNEQIAEKINEFLQEDDLLWIHDYQLLFLPAMIRKLRPSVRIGFFLHIPFPSYELIRLLPKPCRTEIVEGMLGADLIGFHTYEYLRHFLETVQMVGGVKHKNFNVQIKDRVVKTGVYPISIDFEKFSQAADQTEVIAQREKIRETYKGKRIIFSVDRLDYTKGLLYRLDGYEKFLENYSEWKEKIVFILVAIPSRIGIDRYDERKQMVELRIGEINGKLGNMNWSPVVYQYGSLKFEELMGLYTACDVALISPLRDGMNLVAKEFVASRADENGVLMLSDMTGAARELGDALLFNPLDSDEISDKLKMALTLSDQDKSHSMSRQRAKVKKADVHKWRDGFISDLLKAGTASKTQHLDEVLIRSLKNKKAMGKALFLLDYDGTLRNFERIPENAIPDQSLIELLSKLNDQADTEVCIVTGRSRDFVEENFGKTKLKLIAEHGAWVKNKNWKRAMAVAPAWLQGVVGIMFQISENCSGSYVEQKDFSVTWHYRGAADEIGFAHSRELINVLHDFLSGSDAVVLDGNKVVEVKPILINKGMAATKVFDLQTYELLLAVGDDKTDEDLFQAVNAAGGISVKVGEGLSSAEYRIKNVNQVLDLLKNISDNGSSQI